MLRNVMGSFSASLYRGTSSALATALASLAVVAWLVLGPRLGYSTAWILAMNVVSAVITLVMVFVINYAQSRDTAAINAKLDALIYAVERADNRVIGMERLTETEAKAIQAEVVQPLHDEIVKAVRDE